MGDTKTEGIQDNSDTLKKEKENDSLPNGNVEEDLPKEGVEQHKATESSKEESESNRKEQQLGESAESEGSEKVETAEYTRKLRSRPSRTTRSSRSSSIELKSKDNPLISSKESAGDSKSDDGLHTNIAVSDEEEFFGFDSPNTTNLDVFLKLLGKDSEIQDDDSINKENTSDLINDENPPSVESDNSEVNSAKRPLAKTNKKPVNVNISDPKYKKPFDLGWVRELVYRSSGDSAFKRSADVYYYTPNKKKLRSAKEVLSHLPEDLTIENFTFVKEAIGGVGDKEIVREAKAKGGKIPEDGVLRKKATPKATKPAAGKPVKNTPTSESPSSKGSLTPRVVFKNTSTTPKSKNAVAAKPKPAEIKKKKTDSDEAEVQDGESEWHSPEQKNNPTRDVCSIECRLAMGLIPTLQCHLCLCLYHPECVGLQEDKLKPSRAYVCKNCQVLKKQMTSQFQQPNAPLPNAAKVPSPPKKDVKVISVPRTQSIVGALTTWLPHSSSIQVSSGAHNNNNNNNNPSGANTVSSSSNAGSVKTSGSGTVTTIAPSTNTSLNITNSTSIDAVPQSLLTLNGRTYVFVPKHNVVNVSNQSGGVNTAQVSGTSTGPSSTTTAIVSGGDNCTTPGLTNLVATAPGTFVVSTQAPPVNPHGLFLVPFPLQQTTNEPAHPQATIINHSIQAVTPYTPGSQPLAITQTNGVKRVGDSPTEGSSPPPEKKIKRRDIAQESSLSPPNFMMNLNVGFTVLLHAFQFLKVHELLRASCVSKAFEMIAHHESLWSTVRMKNSMVRDWNGFGRALRLRSTKALDLRKMLLPETPEAIAEMWVELGKAVTNLPSLTKIDLGRCTPQAVEIVTAACPQLKSLVTLAIRGAELDLSCCAKCTNLTELKIKSIGGIDLVNVSELKKLKQLRHLALTTIKNLNGIEDVLPDNLESLELGECTNLPDTIATEALVKLTSLKRLRLEKGQGNCPTAKFLQAVANLPNLVQLELINFDIKPGFDVAIGQCTNLKTLLIIPTYVTQSATTNHVVMGGVSKLSQTLTYFIWGLTLELLRVTDLFIDQVEGQKNGGAGKGGSVPAMKKPGAGDSIPILKPLSECNTSSGSDVPDEEVTHLLGRETNRDEKNTSQVDILALPKLQKVLSTLLPNTKIKILKVPFSATWRQTVTDSPAATN
uniref:MBD domain-containing protein n=1 Tax=Rhodnius prolixus TaxID=13249 RepID=T1HC39_RHOPR